EPDLVNAWGGHRAREGHERRAGLAVRARLAEPLGPEARDQREVRQCFDVLYERGPAGDTALIRAGGHERRLRRAAVQEPDQRALLAGEIRARGDGKDDLDRQQPVRLALG